MRKKLGICLLFLLLLTGCVTAPAAQPPEAPAEAPAVQAPEMPKAPQEAKAPEEPEEPEEPEVPEALEPAPEPLHVVFRTTTEALVTPDAPVARLHYVLAVSGEGPQTATLTLTRGGETLETREIALQDGTGTFELSYEFARYQPDWTQVLQLTLDAGAVRVSRLIEITGQNWPDERYAQGSGAALPYSIEVVKNHNAVLVYGQDDTGAYTQLVHAFACSTGKWTPLGSFACHDRYRWRQLFANVEHTAFCYGQYAVVISGHYLFHSVPYFTQSADDLESEEYEKLGTQASLGCIRLAVKDIKWIYDNCPPGTPVNILERETLGAELEPVTPLDPEAPNWDPTDPDKPT